MTRWEGDDVRIELPRVVEAHVRTVGGEVAVTAASGPARIQVEVIAGPPAVVEVVDGLLQVVHEPENLGLLGGVVSRRMEAVVTLTVPPSTPLVLRTVSAEVVVAGLQAGASLTTVSGGIVATDLAGDVSLKTVSGEVQASSVDGDVDLNTVSGGATVSGRIGRLGGRAVSGDLTFDLDASPAASLSTVSGEVLLRLPADAALRLDVSTMSGHLDSAFPVLGTSGRRRLSGTVGDATGAPRVDVRTMSGDVALLRKELSGTSPGGRDDR